MSASDTTPTAAQERTTTDSSGDARRMSVAEEPEPLRYTGHLIRRAQQLHVALWMSEVSRDVSSVQFAALAVLHRCPGISQRQLGSELDLDRSTIADVVSRMVSRGVIARDQDAADRRRKVLTLTADGEAELEDLRPHVEKVERSLTEALTRDERDSLRALLRAVLTHGTANGWLST